jgi:hypothetical protein
MRKRTPLEKSHMYFWGALAALVLGVLAGITLCPEAIPVSVVLLAASAVLSVLAFRAGRRIAVVVLVLDGATLAMVLL